MNKNIKALLIAHFGEHPQGWTSALPHLRNAYMSKPHSALRGLTLYDMLYGVCPRFPVSNLQSLICCKSAHLSPQEYVHAVNDKKAHLHSIAELTLRESFHKLAEHRLWAQTAKRTQTEFQEGYLVIELPNQKGVLGTNTKGPIRTVKLNPTRTHALLETGATLDKDNVQFVRNTSHLAAFKDAYLHPSHSEGGLGEVSVTKFRSRQ
jgi:hypothetical protein